MSWPLNVAPWSDLVVADDAFVRALAGQCVFCRQLVGTAHRDGCHGFAAKLRARHGLVAYFHLQASHPLSPIDRVMRAAEWRDALIEDLRDRGRLDALSYKREARRLRAGVHEALSLQDHHRGLDEGWDGTGWRPSYVRALRDVMAMACLKEAA